MFEIGKKGYVKVDIYRRELKFGARALAPIKKGIGDVFVLFVKKHIQNNIAETGNSILQSTISLKGGHSLLSLTKRIRSVFSMKNNHYSISAGMLEREHRPPLLFHRVFGDDYRGDISELEISVEV